MFKCLVRFAIAKKVYDVVQERRRRRSQETRSDALSGRSLRTTTCGIRGT
jgi:hypothetical protein